MSWTIDEWFVVALARTIRPRETVFHGFGSPCAQVAMHVARRTHARDILLVEGAMYAINPDPPFIPPTSNDASLSRGAAYSMRFEEFFDAAIRGDVDRMFLSGGQIDGYGNTNVTAIGPGAGQGGRPKVKLGGGGGGCNLSATIGHLTVWTTRHRSGRTLVARLRLRHRHGAPHPARHPGRARLHRRRPAVAGHRAGRVRLHRPGRPGWCRCSRTSAWPRSARPPASTCRSPGTCARSPPPSASELAAVRTVDPLGVRTSEFSAKELTRTFNPGHGQDCAC